MKKFQEKLPHNRYVVKVNTGKRFIKFLESYDCTKDSTYDDKHDGYVTIWCGGCYDYALGNHIYPESIYMSAKEFKTLVRNAVGEA